MPSAMAPNRRAASQDQQERPNYDQDVDAFMRDLEFNETSNNDMEPPKPPRDMDEEVQVKKKRKPNPKLDETRLLSQNGVPKLRRLTKTKLRFRGKGHEYADMTTLLNMYQLWLDDLYPKAKFKDGLAMVEKVGHSKRMQITRKAWLDATKPYRREDSPERVGDVEMSGGLGDRGQEAGASRDSDDEREEIFGELGQPAQPRQEGTGDGDAPEDDELDALLNENADANPTETATKQPTARGPFEEDSDPEEDELDALLIEQQSVGTAALSRPKAAGPAPPVSVDNDDFADDEEAMASMGW